MALSDATGDDRTEELDRGVLPTGELPALPNSGQKPSGRKPVRITIKILLAIVVSYFLLPPVLTGFRQAADTVSDVNPLLLVAGFGLQILALFCYSLLTRAALGSAGSMASAASRSAARWWCPCVKSVMTLQIAIGW